MTLELRDRVRGVMLGLACGDAVGTTVEFMPRGTFEPLTDMVGGGPFGLEPGQWTDDTSMALCLAASLCELGRFDVEDQMRRYVAWYRDGYMSSTGRCFDIGNATRVALMKFVSTGEALAGSRDPYSAGNGCLMRFAPVAIYSLNKSPQARLELASKSAETTHAAVECTVATQMFSEVLHRALQGQSKQEVISFQGDVYVNMGDRLEAIHRGDWQAKSRDEVQGSGYVVQALEASLWCIHHTDNYRDAVLMAANLGDDADTTAAICGQIAGAMYGASSIPEAWRARVYGRAELEGYADQLLELASS